jgi:hypothetical protein
MQTFQKIPFRQTRDFGQIFNATFAFIHQNLRKLGKVILFIVGPFILLSGVFSGLYYADILTFRPEQQEPFAFATHFLLMAFFSIVGTVTFIGVICEYVVLYMDNEYDAFDVNEVWKATRKDFWMILLTAIGFAVPVGLGTLMCFIPGIYLFVPLSMILIVRVRERIGFFNAFSRCFELVKNHWWITYGLLIVAFIMDGVLSFVFYIPQYVVTFWSAMHAVKETAGATDYRFLFILTSIVSFVGGFVFYAIPGLVICFQYFNLVERKEAAGLLEKIGKIGASSQEGSVGPQI